MAGVGDGTFIDADGYFLGGSPLSGLVVDLNNDGFPDIVTIGWQTFNFSVLINKGNN